MSLSCSIGIALSPEHGTSYYDLFNHADQALYRAKAKGKNGFCFYCKEDEQFPLQNMQITVKSTPIDSDKEPGLADNNIVRYAFRRLYTSENVEQSVNDVLALIGQKMNVSRVYVFENSDDNKFCSNTYEWCNEGIQPEIRNLQNISYETDIPNYESNFDEQGIFYCPDITTQLKYLNAKTKELAPDVRPGMRCHKALLGLDERCPGCPCQNIRENKNSSSLIENRKFDKKVLAEATLIRWQGEESCLLTCREIPKTGA